MLIDSIIKSKTRIKLLLKFFINPETNSYLRQLANEFDESTNSVRIELNSLTKAKILCKYKNGNTISYKANKEHPLFDEIRSIIFKSIGIDKLINTILDNLGNPEMIFLTGQYSKGIDSGIIDFIIVGNVDKIKLDYYIGSVEKKIDRKIRYLLLNNADFIKLEDKLIKDGLLLLWKND